MEFETPAQLLARLKLGREEFCQRLLTTLLLHAPYPRWNTRSALAAPGAAFLRELHERNFGGGWPDTPPVFVDEFELAPRHDAEKGGAPDCAVLWDDRLWLIELKTEKGSHRADQIPGYFELAHHHYPDARIDLTYITPPMQAPHEPDPAWGRYAHVTWAELVDLISAHWRSFTAPGQREVVDGLVQAIDNLHVKPVEWRAALTAQTALVPRIAETSAGPDEPTRPSPFDLALEAATATAEDGRQRAVDSLAPDLDELLSLRLAVRDRLANSPAQSPLRHVVPWIWRPESTGVPLTDGGQDCGMELRVSRYASARY